MPTVLRPSDEPVKIFRNGKLVWGSNPGVQTDLFRCKADIIAYGGARGGGKLSPDDSLVCTPKGFVRLDGLRIGQQVTDPTTGGTCSVIAIYPHPEMDIWKFVFDDGASLEVGEDHLWAFRLSNHHRPRTKPSSQRGYASRVLGSKQPNSRWNNYRVGTTKEILELFHRGKKLRFPLTEPVCFTPRPGRKQIPMYLLGLFLGDGHLPLIKISTSDKEIADYLKGLDFSNSGDDEWRARRKVRSRLWRDFTQWGLKECRSWEKFIPSYLKYRQLEDRVELLRGLLDTDGTVDKGGRVSFSSTSRKLAQDVQWLVWSLGGKAWIRNRQTYFTYKGVYKAGRPSYNVEIQHPKVSALFKLKRKKARCTDSWNGGYELGRKLISVEYMGKKKARCIQVSSPAGLYVANDFVVTHNSEAAIPWAAGIHCFSGVPQYFEIARYRAVIFRRSFPELKRHIIERSHHFLTGWWKYTERDHIWETRTADGGKAIIEFAYLERPGDVYRYTGAEYARIVFDESNSHSEMEIRFMASCLRTSAVGVKPQMLLLPNPLGAGFAWHKRMFIINSQPRMIYTDTLWPSDKKPTLLTTCFLPAKLWDNPKLLQNDPSYPDRLRSQYGKLADAMMNGSWEEGTHLAFNEFSEVTHCQDAFHPITKQFSIPPWAETWLSIDWGGSGKKAKDFAACVMMAADNKRVYGAWDHVLQGKDIVPFAHEILERVRQSRELQKPRYAVLSHECFADRGMGNTQADQFASVLQKEGITVVKGGRDPVGRLILIREFLRIIPVKELAVGHDATDFEYWNEQFRSRGAQAGEEYMRLTGMLTTEETLPKLMLLLPTTDGRYGCPDLMKNLPLLSVDIGNPLVLAENQHDDSADSLGQALRMFISGPPRPVEEFYKDQIAGNLPDSTIGMDLAMQEAQRQFEAQDEVPSGPIAWPMKKFE